MAIKNSVSYDFYLRSTIVLTFFDCCLFCVFKPCYTGDLIRENCKVEIMKPVQFGTRFIFLYMCTYTPQNN